MANLTKADGHSLPPMDDVGAGFPVHHTLNTPVHVLGHGRSGTSILAALCRKYLGIAFGTESQFVMRYYSRLPNYGDLGNDENFRRLIHDITGERFFARSRKFGWEVDAGAIFANCSERNYRSLLDAIFQQLAECLGMQRWGDKTPEYVNHLGTLRQIFPDAQFVHMVRDGRDVALSGIREPVFGTKNVHKAAREWRHQMSLVDEFASKLPADQIHEVRYEELLSRPEDVFDGLIDFFGIRDEQGDLSSYVRNHIRNDVHLANAGKWKKEFSDAEKVRYERIAGDWLARYGYETTGVEVCRTNVFENVFWDLDNQLRKWSRPEHWKDNLYKAGLRGRRIFAALKHDGRDG